MTKLALLTGGSGAIGGATVSLLHERGWTVEAPTRTRLNMLLGPVMVIRDSIAQIGEEPLGALVFCHGEWFSSDSQGLTDWKRQYASRVVTPARLIDVLLPQLAGGCVVMVASTQAFGGRYQTGPYGAACAGQVRLMPEMTALICFALSLVTVLGGRNLVKGFAALLVGMWIGMIGLDPIAGPPRFTFGRVELFDGVDFTVVAVGLYGLSEMFLSLSQQAAGRPAPYRFRSLLPNLRDLVECRWVLLWSSLTAFFVGVVPGVGATASTMVAYAAAKKYARHPDEFGKGSIRGVAAPEAANNSASYAAMILLFALGIPASGTTAVLLGGLLMVGLQPGPLLFATNPDFVWTVFGTFWIGNLMLVALTVVMIPVLASIVFVPTAILYPVIIGIVMFGVYSINYAMSDVAIALLAGAAGFIMLKLDYSPVPLVLGLVLGPLLERGVRRTLIVSNGDLSIFVQSPIALAFFLLTAAAIAAPIVRRRQRSSV